MKLAKQADLKRALEKRSQASATQFLSFQFSGVAGIADANLMLGLDHFAICGGTGTGKSAILSLLHLCLTSENDGVEIPHRLAGSTASLTVRSGADTFEGRVEVEGSERQQEGYTPRSFFVGLSQRTAEVEAFLRTNEIAILKEGINPSELEPDIRSLAAQICGKPYEKVAFFEFESEGDKIIPFFEVLLATGRYDSRSMSTGELSALYLAWAVQSCEPATILLIEEPEAYLPPSSHSAAFSLICTASVKRRLSFAITTHSCEIASQFSSRSLVSIRSTSSGNIISSNNEAKERVLYRLGLKPQKNAIAFVEDDVAKWISDEIVGQYNFDIVSNIEIVSRDGHSNVRASLDGLPDGISSVKFIGILDGDMKMEAAGWSKVDNLIFLPFDGYMEVELISTIERRTAKFSISVSRKLTKVQDALNDTATLEYHDRFRTIAQLLHMPLEEFTRATFRLWQMERRKSRAVDSFAFSLARAIGVPISR